MKQTVYLTASLLSLIIGCYLAFLIFQAVWLGMFSIHDHPQFSAAFWSTVFTSIIALIGSGFFVIGFIKSRRYDDYRFSIYKNVLGMPLLAVIAGYFLISLLPDLASVIIGSWLNALVTFYIGYRFVDKTNGTLWGASRMALTVIICEFILGCAFPAFNPVAASDIATAGVVGYFLKSLLYVPFAMVLGFAGGYFARGMRKPA